MNLETKTKELEKAAKAFFIGELLKLTEEDVDLKKLDDLVDYFMSNYKATVLILAQYSKETASAPDLPPKKQKQKKTK